MTIETTANPLREAVSHGQHAAIVALTLQLAQAAYVGDDSDAEQAEAALKSIVSSDPPAEGDAPPASERHRRGRGRRLRVTDAPLAEPSRDQAEEGAPTIEGELRSIHLQHQQELQEHERVVAELRQELNTLYGDLAAAREGRAQSVHESVKIHEERAHAFAELQQKVQQAQEQLQEALKREQLATEQTISNERAHEEAMASLEAALLEAREGRSNAMAECARMMQQHAAMEGQLRDQIAFAQAEAARIQYESQQQAADLNALLEQQRATLAAERAEALGMIQADLEGEALKVMQLQERLALADGALNAQREADAQQILGLQAALDQAYAQLNAERENGMAAAAAVEYQNQAAVIADLQAQLMATDEQRMQLIQTAAELQKTLDKIQGELVEAREQHASSMQVTTQQLEERTALVEERTTLVENLKRGIASYESLTAEQEFALKTLQAELEAERGNRQRTFEEFMKEHEARAQEINKLVLERNRAFADIASQHQAHEESVAVLNARIRDLELTIVQLQQDMAALRAAERQTEKEFFMEVAEQEMELQEAHEAFEAEHQARVEAVVEARQEEAEVMQVEARLEALQAQLTAEREGHATMLYESSKEITELQQRVATLDGLLNAAKEAAAKREELHRGNIQRLCDQNDSLLKTAAEIQTTLDHVQAELVMERERRDASLAAGAVLLEEQRALVEQLNAQRMATEQSLNELELALDTTRAELQAERGKRAADFAEILRQQEIRAQELDSLERKTRQLHIDLDQERAAHAATKTEAAAKLHEQALGIEQFRREAAMAEEALAQLRVEKDDLDLEVQKLADDLESERKARADAFGELAHENQQGIEAVAALSETRKVLASERSAHEAIVSNMQNELDNLRLRDADLEQRLAQAEASEAQAKMQYHEAVQIAQEQLMRLRDRMETSRAESGLERLRLEERIRELEDRLTSQFEKIQFVESELAGERATRGNALSELQRILAEEREAMAMAVSELEQERALRNEATSELSRMLAAERENLTIMKGQLEQERDIRAQVVSDLEQLLAAERTARYDAEQQIGREVREIERFQAVLSAERQNRADADALYLQRESELQAALAETERLLAAERGRVAEACATVSSLEAKILDMEQVIAIEHGQRHMVEQQAVLDHDKYLTAIGELERRVHIERDQIIELTSTLEQERAVKGETIEELQRQLAETRESLKQEELRVQREIAIREQLKAELERLLDIERDARAALEGDLASERDAAAEAIVELERLLTVERDAHGRVEHELANVRQSASEAIAELQRQLTQLRSEKATALAQLLAEHEDKARRLAEVERELERTSTELQEALLSRQTAIASTAAELGAVRHELVSVREERAAAFDQLVREHELSAQRTAELELLLERLQDEMQHERQQHEAALNAARIEMRLEEQDLEALRDQLEYERSARKRAVEMMTEAERARMAVAEDLEAHIFASRASTDSLQEQLAELTQQRDDLAARVMSNLAAGVEATAAAARAIAAENVRSFTPGSISTAEVALCHDAAAAIAAIRLHCDARREAITSSLRPVKDSHDARKEDVLKQIESLTALMDVAQGCVTQTLKQICATCDSVRSVGAVLSSLSLLSTELKNTALSQSGQPAVADDAVVSAVVKVIRDQATEFLRAPQTNIGSRQG
jgi:chromosome segregation ATPase